MQEPKFQPAVSVIVPVRNGEHTLPALISSLQHLDYPRERLEFLLVDNNSTDRSRELIRATGWPEVSESRVQSSYAARNAGIVRARGEVLAFTDSDCRPAVDWLRRGLESMAQEQADLVAGEVLMEVRHPNNVYELYSAIHDLQPRKSFQEGYAITANLLVHRRVFETVGLFNPWMISGGDRLFTELAQAAGFRLIFCEQAIVYHQARSTPRSLSAANFRRAFGMMQLRAYGKQLPVPFREWRYYLPGFRPYREFVSGKALPFLDRARIFFLIWRLKLAQARGSWAGARYGQQNPPPSNPAGEWPAHE